MQNRCGRVKRWGAFSSFLRMEPEGLDVEFDGGFDIGEGFLVSIALTHHHTRQAMRVTDIPIGMFFDYDLDVRHAMEKKP